jgi:hypothetical protein
MQLDQVFIEQYNAVQKQHPNMPFGSNLEIAKENTIRFLSNKIDEIIISIKQSKKAS